MVSGIPRKHAHALQRLHSLAFVFGTFAYAKDQASSPLDGLLQENPTQYSPELFEVNEQSVWPGDVTMG